MKVESLELELEWSCDLEICNLRKFILNEIKPYGFPLRWVITDATKNEKALNFRKLLIEAVVIVS